MSKHTKGPWKVIPYNDNGDHGFAVQNASGEQICETKRYSNGWRTKLYDQAQDNAKLIAAAPDMLEALLAVVNAHEGAIVGGANPACSAAWDLALNAISQARQ